MLSESKKFFPYYNREIEDCPQFLLLAWRSLCGGKTVRKDERARFLPEGEESEALNRVAFESLGQKQRVLEPYSLSLPSMVASSIPEYFLMIYETCLAHTIWKRTDLSNPHY